MSLDDYITGANMKEPLDLCESFSCDNEGKVQRGDKWLCEACNERYEEIEQEEKDRIEREAEEERLYLEEEARELSGVDKMRDLRAERERES